MTGAAPVPADKAEPAAAFPWGDIMHAGLGILRLCPRDFWNATPREIAAALGRAGGSAAPERATLEALMRNHPDRT